MQEKGKYNRCNGLIKRAIGQCHNRSLQAIHCTATDSNTITGTLQSRQTNTTPTHGMPGRPTDRREPSTCLSYALSAAASMSSDAVPVGNVPCGDVE